ncbi:hypothetical protein [Niallia sp. 03133]|uniref:hypothetical protein n=1 Tax=Niallia sp. 03133 TaxID=3458060 RepID=UPI004044F653
MLIRYTCEFCNELIGLVEKDSEQENFIKQELTWEDLVLCKECLDMGNEQKLAFLEEAEEQLLEYSGALDNAALNWSEQVFIDEFGMNLEFYYETYSKKINEDLEYIEALKKTVAEKNNRKEGIGWRI